MRVPRQRRTALGSYSLAGTRSEPIFMSGGAPQGHVDSPETRLIYTKCIMGASFMRGGALLLHDSLLANSKKLRVLISNF
jgi:hypothetical protein